MDIDQHPTAPSSAAPRRRRGLLVTGIVAAALGVSALSNGLSYAADRGPSFDEAVRQGGIAVPLAAVRLVPIVAEANLASVETALDRLTDTLP